MNENVTTMPPTRPKRWDDIKIEIQEISDASHDLSREMEMVYAEAVVEALGLLPGTAHANPVVVRSQALLLLHQDEQFTRRWLPLQDRARVMRVRLIELEFEARCLGCDWVWKGDLFAVTNSPNT